MASENDLTYDQDPPHRPSLDELGGGQKQNHPTRKPDPATMLTAEDCNQGAKQTEAFGRVMPLARLWVTFTLGVPGLQVVQALGANVELASFDVVEEGTGQTLIKWKTGPGAPAGALPLAVGVKVGQTDDIEIDRIRAQLTTDGGDPAARVKSKLGAVATDCNFWLEIC